MTAPFAVAVLLLLAGADPPEVPAIAPAPRKVPRPTDYR